MLTYKWDLLSKGYRIEVLKDWTEGIPMNILHRPHRRDPWCPMGGKTLISSPMFLGAYCGAIFQLVTGELSDVGAISALVSDNRALTFDICLR